MSRTTGGWACAGTYEAALASLRELTDQDRDDYWWADQVSTALRTLARPIVVAGEQLNALPVPDSFGVLGSTEPSTFVNSAIRDVRTPFRTTYVSCAGARVRPPAAWRAEEHSALHDAITLEGVMIASREDGSLLTTVPFYRALDGPIRALGFGKPSVEEDGTRSIAWWMTKREEALSGHALPVHVLERVIALLDLLMSANVALVEQRPTRQVRRAADRKGRDIALTIQIGRPRRHSTPRGGAANYSHRFDRAGCMQHYTRGPIFDANPSKRVMRNGKEVVLVYRGPCVIGDETLPYVPKLRVMTGERAVV